MIDHIQYLKFEVLMKLNQLNELLNSSDPCPFMLDIDDDTYRQSNGVSQSELKLIKSKSLYHYRYGNTSKKDTDALIVGRAIHKAVFEWDDFKNVYRVRPKDMNLRTKAGRELLEKMKEGGKYEVLTRDDMAKIKRMRASIKRRPHILELINGCLFERSTWARIDGTLFKIRTDGYKPGVVLDLKTTMDASPNTFIRDIFKYGYHIQAAFYSDVIEHHTGSIPAFKIIALEKSFPFEACLYELSPKSIAIGRKTYLEELEKLQRAIKTNVWPSYPDVTRVKPPEWLVKQAFDGIE